MNNSSVESILNTCKSDLDQVRILITGLGIGSNITPYLTHYSIIRACGAIELSFKYIIADFCSHRSKQQVKSFLDSNVRENSCNPSYDKICKMVKDFDINWHINFKNSVNSHTNKTQILTSLQSLVNARNEFAHGGNPGSSISDVINYFTDSRIVIEILDSVVI